MWRTDLLQWKHPENSNMGKTSPEGITHSFYSMFHCMEKAFTYSNFKMPGIKISVFPSHLKTRLSCKFKTSQERGALKPTYLEAIYICCLAQTLGQRHTGFVGLSGGSEDEPRVPPSPAREAITPYMLFRHTLYLFFPLRKVSI